MTTTHAAPTRRLPAPNSVGAWVLAARPATLPVAVAPVVVGAAIASGSPTFRPLAVCAALAGALLIQIGTNFANDAFDHLKGADDERRIGPPRAVSTGLLSPRAVFLGMFASFVLATFFGLYLTAVAGKIIALTGLVCIASGIAYTGGPFPLGYNGLGDAFVFAFFGEVAVVGTTYVASGDVSLLGLLAAIPVGALATCVLVVNNVRDYEGDVRAGKRTLVARFGRGFGVAEYLALLLLSAAAIIAIAVLRLASPLCLLGLAPLVFGLKLWGIVRERRDGQSLNKCLANTAKLMLAVSMLLALGIWVGRVVG